MYSVHTLETDNLRSGLFHDIRSGPGEDTALIAYRITTEAFTNLNVGYASALAMLLFVVMAIFSWLNIRVMSKFDS